MNNHLMAVIRRDRIALALIAILSLALNTFHLNREGFGNLYYAAGVKSMLESWHNFFYLAYDPSGVVSIDKPPLGFWLQAGSAAVFGFHGWALILPQVIASFLSILMLYRLVGKVFGSAAGLIAALILAVTPIFVATARNNTIDSILVLAMLLAAWMLHKASEGNHAMRWILGSAAMIGIGFNIKMLEAYIVLPAFGLFLWLTPQIVRGEKLKQLCWAAVVLLSISMSWAVIVDLTPKDQRPYVGSTRHNSVLELVLQHNAAERFSIGNPFTFPTHPDAGRKSVTAPYRTMLYNINSKEILSILEGVFIAIKTNYLSMKSDSGPFRLFTADLGGQIGWLLPFVLLSSFALLWRAPLLRLNHLDLGQRHLLFWLTWLGTMSVLFSSASLFHRYYTVMMAPAIAALSGIGLIFFWQKVIQWKRSGWILFAALPFSAIFAIAISWSYHGLQVPLALAIGGFAIVALLAIAVILLLRPDRKASIYKIALTACLLMLLAGPLVWASTPSIYGATGADPIAGPELKNRHLLLLKSKEEENLIDFLRTHYVNGNFLVATTSSRTSAPLILDSGLPILTLGGYNGTDPILTPDHLQSLAQDGKIKYFLLAKNSILSTKQPYMDWIRQHCRVTATYHLSEFVTSSDKLKNSFELYQFIG